MLFILERAAPPAVLYFSLASALTDADKAKLVLHVDGTAIRSRSAFLT